MKITFAFRYVQRIPTYDVGWSEIKITRNAKRVWSKKWWTLDTIFVVQLFKTLSVEGRTSDILEISKF
jgi:hypothetical protein